jgi:hypothetical protein
MKKYSKGLRMFLLFLVTFVFLQGFSAYHFFYIEQFQLFLTTPSFFFESILHPGGVMEYISRFLVQFFIVPYFGAAIESIILLSVFAISSKLILRSERSKTFFIAPGSIFLSCLVMCFNFNIFLQGTLSFLLCLVCLDIFLPERNSFVRDILVFITVPVLYWLAGPISVLFAVCFFLNELFAGEGKKRIVWLLLPAFAFLVSWLGVRLSFTGSFRTSFLPDMYCQPKLSPPFLIYIPWLLLLVWIPIDTFLQKFNIFGKKSFRVIHTGIQFILLILFFWQGIVRFGDRASYEVKKLDYYARNCQWDRIIADSEGKNINNYLHINYVNLALAEKGCLLEKMFLFNQKGISSLEVSRQKNNIISTLISDIRFSVGDIASSQRYAFEGYETSSGGGSGRLLKRLVQTNLIYGEYAVAEKYLLILEHTFIYRKWATSQRKFLYNDSSCMNDTLIAAKRKNLSHSDSRTISSEFPQSLKILTEINEENKIAQSYLLAFYLLVKDLKGFENFLKLYNGSEIKPGKISGIYQQAVLMYYESQPEKWEELGVSPETILLYKHYKYTFLKNKQNPKVKEIMQKQFSSTYWLYFQFINI